jgi:hypothetical protein
MIVKYDNQFYNIMILNDQACLIIYLKKKLEKLKFKFIDLKIYYLIITQIKSI